jgi:hypothetical protein
MKATGKTYLYHTPAGWRWHSIIGGNVVAESGGDGYKSKSFARKMAQRYGPAGFTIVEEKR